MKKITFLFLILISNITIAQDGTVDTSFNNGTGFNSKVSDIALRSNGKIIVIGNFGQYNGSYIDRLVQLDTNGNIDPTFIGGKSFSTFNNPANSIVVQTDGKIIIGGLFSFYDQVIPARGIIRLNLDGSRDNSFNNGGFGFGQNNEIYSIALQPNGKIVAAGTLGAYNNTPLKNIVNINSNGNINTDFNIGTGFGGVYYYVPKIVSQSDGKIIAVGPFSTYNGTTSNHIARINTDGSIDSSFNIGNGFGSSTNTVVIQPDGKIIIGTSSNSYNGNAVKGIIRLNQNGTVDTSFHSGSGFGGTIYSIQSIALQADGKIIVAGGFDSYNGTISKNIIRLLENGNIDTSFNVGSGFNNGTINSIKLQSDGKILLGGNFTSYNGITANRIIRLNNPSLEQYILATDKFKENTITVLPNPTKDILKIQGTSIKNLTITNITGEIVVTSTSNEINISNLQNGIYIVKVECENGRILVKKVIKN